MSRVTAAPMQQRSHEKEPALGAERGPMVPYNLPPPTMFAVCWGSCVQMIAHLPFMSLCRSYRAECSVLGRAGDTEIYKPVKHNSKVRVVRIKREQTNIGTHATCMSEIPAPKHPLQGA